jgi:single-stranded DNA-binding protein
MSNKNEVIFNGSLGADPVLKTLKNGSEIAKFNMLVQDQNPFWISCEGWDDQAMIIMHNFRHGDFVYVKGKFKVEKWMDQGQPKIKYIVVVEKIDFDE